MRHTACDGDHADTPGAQLPDDAAEQPQQAPQAAASHMATAVPEELQAADQQPRQLEREPSPPKPSTSWQGREDESDGEVELAAFANRVLQRVQPGAELDTGSLRMLSLLLDQVTERVLDEAQRISSAGGASAAPGSSTGGSGSSKGGNKAVQAPPLTSLDIHKVRMQGQPLHMHAGTAVS